MKQLIALGFVLVCTCVNAERFLIAGKPSPLEIHPNHFSFRDGYVQPSEYQQVEYHFITLNNVERVCFMQPMPQFNALERIQLILEEPNDETQIRWQCYRFDPRYFELDF